MARFPFSYGSIDLGKYPRVQYLNVRLMKVGDDGKPVLDERGQAVFEDQAVPCLVLPYSDKWMSVSQDANGNVHGRVNINIDDATGLNKWAKEQADKEGKKYSDFQAQIHLTPMPNASDAWKKALAAKYDHMPYADFEAAAKKLKLDEYSINASEYYQQHPDKKPTREQIIAQLVSREMQSKTAAGRIYCNSLVDTAPVPQAAAESSVAALPSTEQMPAQQDDPFASMTQSTDKLPF